MLVCGDRNWDDQWIVTRVLDAVTMEDGIDVIIEGCARGADRCAEVWAEACGVPVEHFPAGWDTHGKPAGIIRNQQMLVDGKPELVLAFHDDLEHSKGTGDMVKRARRADIPVYNLRRVR